MPCWSHRSEIGVCSRRWRRRMATFSWAVNRFRVFLGMGAPPLEVVAYSSRRFVPFQLKQDIRDNLIQAPGPSTPTLESPEEWERRLHAWVDTHPVRAITIDDSRESLYAGRGE